MKKSIFASLFMPLCGVIFLTCTKNQVPESVSISGPDEGFISESNTFSVMGADPDDDSLSYFVDWGDGDSTGWTDYYASTESIQVIHTYSVAGLYAILAQAKDVNGDTSAWSEPHTIAILTEMPKKWKFGYDPGATPFTTPPAISDNGTVYFIVNGLLFALDPSGTVLWSYDFGTSSKTSSPSIGDDGTIYVGVSNGEFTALNSNGSLKWTYPVAYPTGGAIGSDGTIYLGSSDSCLYRLTPAGNLAWSYKSLGPINNTPIIGQSGNIYFGTENGYLYAITSTGALIWKRKLSSSFCYPSAISDDETIYALTVNGLSAVNRDGSIKWTCSFQHLSTPNGPVVSASGNLYIGAGYKLNAISPSGKIVWSFAKSCHATPAITQSNDIVAPISTGIGIEPPYEIYRIGSDGIPKARSQDLLWGQAVAIANDGTIYASGTTITFGYGYLFALEGDSPAATSGWPMYQHDAKHTGRAGP